VLRNALWVNPWLERVHHPDGLAFAQISIRKIGAFKSGSSGN
jgi:hypothetical protein